MQIIDGKLVSKATKESIKSEIENLGATDKIGLAVILIGDDSASQVYVRNKINACAELGIKSTLVKLSATVDEKTVYDEIAKLNADKNINGVMLQLPIPKHLDEYGLLSAIDPNKDVDGNHYAQKGKMFIGKAEMIPCTPYGVIRLLDYYNIPVQGKHAVVVGRSNLVGKPLALLLLDRNATVTVCHSKTADLGAVCATADILCVAIGKTKMIKRDMVKEGAVVIDVGMDRDENGKLCGDVDFADVADKCSYITPVPGGVGVMTVTMLMANTVKAYRLQNGIK